MSDAGKSYRQILRSTSIIGGASAINILIGLLRIKVAAVLLGPAGVGLIGLLTTLAGTASTIAGMGFGTVGTRQIATAVGHDDAEAIAAARRALFWGTSTLAVLGAALFWALRDVLARQVLGDASLARDVGWLGLAVGLAVAAVSQSALLNGMRRIGDIARVNVLSALLATALGVGALLLWGNNGLMAFVVAAPLASFVMGHVFVARLPRITTPRTPILQLARQWSALFRLGAAFMVAGLAGTVGQLLVRALVQRQLGPDAVGYFQAASTISITYIGFVLGAMVTDYYPRLTATIHDHAAVNRMVNEQTEMALLLAGPVFLALAGLAPWAIELLYSNSFHPSAGVLRWQVIGDVLKVCSWPLGFVMLAAGDGRTYMVSESLGMIAFVLLTWLLLPFWGVVGTGMAFVGMYLIYLPLVYTLAKRKTGFGWSPMIWRQAALLLLGTLAVMAAAVGSVVVGGILGLVLSALFGIYSANRLAGNMNLTGLPGKAARFSRRMLARLGMTNE